MACLRHWSTSAPFPNMAPASRWPAGPRRRRGTRRWCESMSSRQPRSRLRQTVSGRRQPVGSEPPRDAAIGERKSQDHRHAAAYCFFELGSFAQLLAQGCRMPRPSLSLRANSGGQTSRVADGPRHCRNHDVIRTSNLMLPATLSRLYRSTFLLWRGSRIPREFPPDFGPSDSIPSGRDNSSSNSSAP